MLPNMPMDILCEVFCYLHPQDLLHLARTTKAFRKLLMSRSSAAIWRRARENIPRFPSCPKDMMEPEYAAFMIEGPHCQVSHHAEGPSRATLPFD
ncbi:hypothetical protein C8T65DRAFT_572287 [Cerioporus squamosus]|nr:hypothetical protein C8T65DRAFT_572287 [Cerioporus squamosus]